MSERMKSKIEQMAAELWKYAFDCFLISCMSGVRLQILVRTRSQLTGVDIQLL